MARPSKALLLPLVLASCATPDVAVDAGYMVMRLAGDFGLAGSGGGGSARINLGQGLDIANADSPYAKVEAQLLGLRVSLSGFDYTDSGDSILSTSFGDISAGSTVTTDVDLFNLKGTIAYDIINNDYLRISPGVGLDYFDIDMRMVATAPVSAFEEVDFQVPVPMPYLSAQLKYEDFVLDTELSGASVDLQDADGLYWDISAKLRYQPLPPVGIFVGYRYLRIKADGDTGGQDFSGDIHLNGLFFGGRIAF